MREIQFLVYNGKREHGELLVKREPAISPHRRLKYYKGMELQIGKDIPIRVAKYISGEFPTFDIVKREFEDVESLEIDIMEFFRDKADLVEPKKFFLLMLDCLCEISEDFKPFRQKYFSPEEKKVAKRVKRD